MNDLIAARLVWDGDDEVRIPPQLGKPREDQMQGTAAERLAELCGRTCYDSLGKGRSSADFHAHILEVGHGSVYEHWHATLETRDMPATSLFELIGRPGLTVSVGEGIRITVNVRTAVDWDKFQTTLIQPNTGTLRKTLSQTDPQALRDAIREAMHPLAPRVVPVAYDSMKHSFDVVRPACESEQWVSLYLSGSRGFSHEMVRHGDFTAISQRSTRYCDESESPWVEHPILTKHCDEAQSVIPGVDSALRRALDQFSRGVSSDLYVEVVSTLQSWLVSRGVDKLTARKQARGAARGYLGNALHTEMVFSASVAQWKRILRLRLHPAADAEIREVMAKALAELKSCRYGGKFDDWRTRPSPDGIGEVLVEATIS